MEQIKFINYRCFKSLNLEFKSGLNILIGDNASGKTTVIRGVRSALSSFFTGYSDTYTKFLGLSKDDFMEVISSEGVLLNSPPIEIEFIYADLLAYPEIMGPLWQNEESKGILVLESEKAGSGSRTKTGGLKHLKDYAGSLYRLLFDHETKTQQYALPLFASFSTEDIHSSRKIDSRIFKEYFHKPSFGYYECLQGEGFFNYWIKRLIVLAEGQKNLQEIEIVRNALRKALGPEGCGIFRDIVIRPHQGYVYFILSDGREVKSENLSDGYQRLANIVIDLAFRCAILNRAIWGEDACKNTIGTVLIDEIDLHLHPTLQSQIVNCLKHTFENIQFIISTHAPMVLSGVETTEENRIYKLAYTEESGYTATPTYTYGLDASMIIKTQMNEIPRVRAVQQELDAVWELINADRYNEAMPLIDSLREKYGDAIPEVSEMEAMLNFEIEEDEED